MSSEMIPDEINGDEAVVKDKRTRVNVEINPDDFSLDSYIGNYSGYTRLFRLLHIADHCKALELDALKLAHDIVKTTLNTGLYSTICDKIGSRLGPAYDLDIAWREQIDKKAQQQQDKLEIELGNHRTSLIKENIRAGHSDLGDFFYARGDLPSALKSYVRMRDYSSTTPLMVNLCLTVIRVAIEIQNYPHAVNYATKAEMLPDVDKMTQSKLKVCGGLANLEGKKYKIAARKLLEITVDIGDKYNEVVSQQDLATYTGLCALATFDRPDLKKRVIDNSTFKTYLELVPDLREAIFDFYSSRYAPCMKRLEKLKATLLLDIHLHEHVDSLYQTIRNRALVQYFSPFISVDMNTMAEAFNTSVAGLEKEICHLIQDNSIAARIDSHNKRLYARQHDERSSIFNKTLNMGEEYEENTKGLMLRVNLLKADMFVKSAGGNSRSVRGDDLRNRNHN